VLTVIIADQISNGLLSCFYRYNWCKLCLCRF